MKKVFFAFAGLVIAATALAELSKYKDWDKSADAYFLTPAERAEWKKVATDEDAEKFILLYWAKRDPSPATAQNEFRDEVGRRIAAADQQFKMARYKRGADSVRGRLLIVLGTPSRAAQQAVGTREAPETPSEGGFQSAPAGPGGGSESEENISISIWTYDKDKLAPLGLSELRARILLDPARGVDSLQNGSEVEKAIAAAAEKSIVNPNATVLAGAAPAAGAPAAAVASGAAAVPPSASGKPAPPAAAPAPAAAAAPAPPAAVMPLPAAVKSALEAVDSKSADAGFWSGTFRAVSGDEFLAFQFYLPADKPAYSGSSPLKLGGIVTNAAGEDVHSIWEPANLSEVASGTRKDRVLDRSVALPPGNYKGVFGIFASEGQPPLAAAVANFTLAPKTTDFEVSPLLLSNGIFPLTKRPGPVDPFVFGMDKPMKVEPKGDRHFLKQDSLWYFYVVANPALPAAPAGGEAPKPRIQTRINVQLDGKDAFAPFTGPAELQPIAEGYYATGSEIPLAAFEPGYYSFLVKVRDLNAAPGSAAGKGVDRKEDFVVLMPDGSMPQKKGPTPAPPAKKKT